MGNMQSIPKKSKLVDVADYVAAKYILTQNFNDMKKLNEPEYCNKLVILTSKILNKYLKEREVKYLAEKIKNGHKYNETDIKQVLHLKKEDLEILEDENGITKERMCIGIAAFYIKVAHLFAAIISTVNPEFEYEKSDGSKVILDLYNKTDERLKEEGIDINMEPKLIRNGICANRIKSLQNETNFIVDVNEEINILPSFCSFNDGKDEPNKSLKDEPGIPELKNLYYDKYDYEKGEYYDMTLKTKKIYEEDLKTFYKAFTGKDIPKKPDSDENVIKQFRDIPLKSYSTSEGCVEGGIYTKPVKGYLKERLFLKYAEHIKKMMEKTKGYQDKLLSELDKLFGFQENNKTKKRSIVIHPDLKEDDLPNISETVRKIIIELYISCEKDYYEGLEIFKGIIQKLLQDRDYRRLELDQYYLEQLSAGELPELYGEPRDNYENENISITPNYENENISITSNEQKPINVSSVIPYYCDNNGNLLILLGKEPSKDDKFTSFAGHVEPGETISAAAIREFSEESKQIFSVSAIQ